MGTATGDIIFSVIAQTSSSPATHFCNVVWLNEGMCQHRWLQRSGPGVPAHSLDCWEAGTQWGDTWPYSDGVSSDTADVAPNNCKLSIQEWWYTIRSYDDAVCSWRHRAVLYGH